MTELRGAAATDVGRVRQANEDRYLVGNGLFAVADGVGGHQAGEVASQTSVEQLEKAFTTRTTQGLVDAIHDANRAVWDLAQQHAEKRGMGTTMTALALVDDDGQEQLALANVGDSRGYLLQRGDLLQVTEDHSLVEELVREGQLTHEEAQVHPQRSIITRALGMEPEIDVDAWTLTPYAGDRILLCSDGLTNEVGTDRIAAILRQLGDPQEAARELVRQARANGGNDNITVVVVDVVDDGGKAEEASAALAGEEAHDSAWTATRREAPEKQGPSGGSTATALRTRAVSAPAEPKLKPPRHRRFTWRVLAFLAAFVAILGVVAGSLAWYGRSAYFVALDANEVAIFKGRPGGFLWFKPTLVERKAFTTDQVPPAKLDELRAGKEEASRADADRYVNNLRQQASASATTTTAAPATTLPPTTRGTPPT